MSGFKPNQMVELLAISKSQFRYWRGRLDPFPLKSSFSARNVLAYRIIKALIEHRGVSIIKLGCCQITHLYSWCDKVTLEEARNSQVVIDVNARTLAFLPAETTLDSYNIDLHFLQLRNIVDQHQQTLFDFGR